MITLTSDKERYLSTKQAAKLLGIHPITLYRWVKKGKIRYVKTPTGRIKFPYSEILRLKSSLENEVNALIYARVPDESFKDSGLLARQVESLKVYAKEKGYNIVEIIEDIALFSKKSLVKIVNYALTRKINKVLVVDETRLAPILHDVLKELLSVFGVTIETIDFKDEELNQAKKIELIDVMRIYLRKNA